MKRWSVGIAAGLCLLVLSSTLSAQTPAFEIITTANVAQIVPVGSLGTGQIQGGYYDAENNVDLISMGSRWHYTLDDLGQPPQWELLGNVGFETLTISPDGRWYMSRGGDLWDNAQKKIVQNFSRYWVSGAVFSSDSTLLAIQLGSLCPDIEGRICNELVLWDIPQQRFRLRMPGDSNQWLKVIDDNHLLAVADYNTKQTTFYDTQTGEVAFQMPVLLSGWSEDGTTATSFAGPAEGESEAGGSMIVWDMTTRVPRMTLSFLPHEVLAVSDLNEDGSRLLLSGYPFEPGRYGQEPLGGDDAVTLWDTAGLRLTHLTAPATPFNHMALSPDGRYIAAYALGVMGTTASPLYLYDISSPQPLWSLELPSWRGIHNLDFRADSRKLLVTYESGMINEVDVLSGQVLPIAIGAPGYAEDIVFGTDSIVTSTGDGFYVWDAQTLTLRSLETSCKMAAYGAAFGMRFCMDDRQETLNLSNGIQLESAGEEYFWPLSAQFSPDEQRLAAVSQTQLLIWDTATGHLLHKQPSDNPNFSQRTAFTADGRFLIEGDHARVWALPELKQVAQVRLDSLWYSQFAFSESQNWLAYPTKDGYVYVWPLSDILSGQDATAENTVAKLPLSIDLEQSFDQFSGPSYVFMDASPDGRLLALTGFDGIMLYDMTTHTLLRTLPDGGNMVRFSPDGRFVIVGDGTWCCGGADESLHMGRARVWGIPLP